MTDTPVSVVIVSRGRPAALRRALMGVSQQFYAPFEIVVVADPAGVMVAEGMPFARHLKIVAFDEANISRARNIGVSHAAGDIVAFIDDDAVPEPTWLQYLTAPAQDVAAMGGFVRGRNGISFQWKAREIAPDGSLIPIGTGRLEPDIRMPGPGGGIKTEGTNMAFWRDRLVEIGGFDPAFRYFLDETDVNLRLAQAGHQTAIVPMAEVHHGFEANAQRSAERVPADLFEIGASWGVFCSKYPNAETDFLFVRRHRETERKRLLRHMAAGTIDAWDVRNKLRRFDDGYAAGLKRHYGEEDVAEKPESGFRQLPGKPNVSLWFQAEPANLSGVLAEAEEAVEQGQVASVLCLSRTALYHQLRYTDRGVWVQRGGIYGRSERDDPLIKWTTRMERTKRERERVARQRGLSDDWGT